MEFAYYLFSLLSILEHKAPSKPRDLQPSRLPRRHATQVSVLTKRFSAYFISFQIGYTMAVLISQSAYYKLTNKFTGPSAGLKVMESSNDDLLLHVDPTDTHKSPIQYWQFIPIHGTNKFHICTEYRSAFYSIDIFREDKSKPHLMPFDHVSGQEWTLLLWPDGTVRMSNDFSGRSMYFGVDIETKVAFLERANHAGQHWTLTPVERKCGVCGSSGTVVAICIGLLRILLICQGKLTSEVTSPLTSYRARCGRA